MTAGKSEHSCTTICCCSRASVYRCVFRLHMPTQRV